MSKVEDELTDEDRARSVLGVAWGDPSVAKDAAKKLMDSFDKLLQQFGQKTRDPAPPQARVIESLQGGSVVAIGYLESSGGTIQWGNSERFMNIAGQRGRQWHPIEMRYDFGRDAWLAPDGRRGLEVLSQALVEAWK